LSAEPFAVQRWLSNYSVEHKRLFASSAIVTFLALVNGGLSYLVQILLAAHFGTRREMDAYLIAYALPLLIATAATDAVATTFIPIFISHWSKGGKPDAWRLTNALITFVFVALVFLAIVLGIAAKACLSVMAPGLVGASRDLVVGLFRLMLPTIACLVLSGVLTAVNQAMNRFTQPALAPVVNAVTMLLCIVVLVPRMGIYGVALGTTLGAVARLLWLAPIMLEARNAGDYWGWRHAGMNQFWDMTLPLVFAGFAYKANVVIERFIASWMPEGRIASLGYAYQIVLLLVVLTTQGLGITLFPRMSHEGESGNLSKLGSTLAAGMRWTLLVITPIVAGVAVLREPIIRLLFQRGAFSESSSHDTGLALLGYLGAVYAGGLANLPSRAFVAVKDVWTGIRIGLAGVVLLIALDLVLAAWLGFVGLAIAYSAMSIFTLGLWIRAVSRRFIDFNGRSVFSSGLSALAAAVGMTMVCYFLQKLLLSSFPPTRLGIALELAVIGSIGCGVYLALTAVFFRFRSAQVTHGFGRE
jgi:putative peptidoglycan lipid II flippase